MIIILGDELNFNLINRETLMKDKSVIKLIKKQQKEMDLLKKKHQKEKSVMNKQHTMVVDTLMIKHDKEKQATEKSIEKKLKRKGYVRLITITQATEREKVKKERYACLSYISV